jgi:hypothetical protein
LPTGFSGCYYIVDNQDMACAYRATQSKRRLQIALPMCRSQAGLVGRSTTPDYVFHETNPGLASYRHTELSRLIEATRRLPAPMQRDWQQAVDVIR